MPDPAHRRSPEPGATTGPVHVVIPTHTTRHLDLVLAGLARQTLRPDHIIVSCDTDDEAIGAVIKRCCRAFGLSAWWLRRASTGGERLCQVRNNAVRFLVEELDASRGRVLILDGDMLAGDTLVAQHHATAPNTPLVYAYRVNLDEATTGTLDAQRIFGGEQTAPLTAADRKELDRRDRRARRHLLMRRLYIGPPHKPKLLGGHFSCDLSLYLRLNGFDELYQGWGFKDDEFAYRAARTGAGVRIAISEIIAWHLWHPTRQPSVPMRDLPTAQRFEQRARLPLIAEHGIENPLDQPNLAWTGF